MKGIILAGGKGTRLYPVTLETPKPLIPINGKPLINFSVELLVRHGVNEIGIIVRPSDKRPYDVWHGRYASEFPQARIFFLYEPVPMGTMGYIFHHLSEWMDGQDVVVTNGDGIIKGLDVSAMLSFHRSNGSEATVSLMKMEDPGDYGSVMVNGTNVSRFSEKSLDAKEGLVSAGLYIIGPRALKRLKGHLPDGPQALMFEKDLFPLLASAGALGAFISDGKFFDCGTPERWEKAIREA